MPKPQLRDSGYLRDGPDQRGNECSVPRGKVFPRAPATLNPGRDLIPLLIPPEWVFDQGIGDLFVARVAGNFVNDDILGSLEFASKLAGSKLIVIMGHTGCGAVQGASTCASSAAEASCCAR
jgi:carbonic anhydrase